MNKAKGGPSLYDPARSVCVLLDSTLANRLLQTRERVRQKLLTERTVEWQGIDASDLEFNKHLSYGQDFGGKEPARYLPALRRYEGRFFQTLGLDGQAKMRSSEHHVLFLSGLYGLVGPDEHIQLYCCPLAPPVVDQWIEEDLLTEVLRDYVERRGILRIFDLTAVMAYRNLVDWDLVCGKKTDILHCFSATSSGDSALIPFAQLLKGRLLKASEEELINIKPESSLHDVIFRSIRQTPEGLPDEIWSISKAERELPLLQSHRLENVSEVIKGGNPIPAESTNGPDEWLFSITSQFRKDCLSQLARAGELIQGIVEVCRKPTTPKGDRIKPLSRNLQGKWRYRFGNFRIIYLPNIQNRTVYFLKATSRDSAYD